jgi:peptidoglycan/LPS O-acetylase OafA/YrhL
MQPAATEMAAPPCKLHSVQSARAIAALLVVLHHISLRFEQRVAGINFLSIFDHFGFAGVDLFFVISGLIMVVTCHHHFGSGAAMLTFLWRRATRIYPLYWIFTIVQLAAILLIPSATGRAISAQSIVASFLLLPQTVYPILAPGWTLVYELFFYLVFSLLFFIPRRFSVHFLLAWGIVTIALYWMQTTEGLSSTTDLLQLPIYASPLTLEFLCGCFVGFLYKLQVTRFTLASLVIGTIWFAGGWVLVESWTNASAEFGLTRVMVFGIASTLILYGLVASETSSVDNKISCWVANRGLIAIGDASYSLYLSHLLMINLFVIIWSRFSFQGWITQSLFETVVFLICIAFSIATYRAIERPMLDWLRRRQQPQVSSPESLAIDLPVAIETSTEDDHSATAKRSIAGR